MAILAMVDLFVNDGRRVHLGQWRVSWKLASSRPLRIIHFAGKESDFCPAQP
jgi:hypothetical protein